MKKIWSLILVIALVLTMFAGCGGAATTGQPAAQQPAGEQGTEIKTIRAAVMPQQLSLPLYYISQQGWDVENVDITIAMQRPKLAPYIMSMRECLASVMGIDVSQVSVKATTTERLGFVGRGEGCEVYAVALLRGTVVA